VISAKSGLPIRGGIARIAAWGWMFKMFTQRDWAIFTQNFNQPLRVGKYQNGATEEDKDTLFRAVQNIAGDCAAIMPSSMEIEFIESKITGTRCLVPDFNGVLYSKEWKEALWDKFYTAAPRRQRQCVERYNIVKRA